MEKIMQGIIYCYTNIKNGKKYVGRTIDPEQRKRNHICEALKRGSDYYFHRALRKHGLESFTYEILGEFEEEILDDMEIKFINEYNTVWPNGYNQCFGGSNRMTPEIREKISQAKKAKFAAMTEEERKEFTKKVCLTNLGKKQSDFQKQKAREANQKSWKLTDPNGNKIIITNLRKFCLETSGLEHGTGNFVNVANGKLKHFKQWKCERLD
jgi:group I intron endonuclease